MDIDDEKLSERDFIQEGYKKNPFPFWLWLFIVVILITILLGLQSVYHNYVDDSISKSPFMQVTNREFSLFLWQNPEFMRANARMKSGYLVGFEYIDKQTIEPGFEEKFVEAPPDVLFRYHVWNRLIKNEIPNRKIDGKEFLEFLEQVPEWKPDHWVNAPKAYKETVAALPVGNRDLQNLPQDVKIAFIGWKNFYKEGEAINRLKPSVEDVQKFLTLYPHYSRNFWRNIVSEDYLKIMLSKDVGKQSIPTEQLSPFLKAALYNFQSSSL